MLNIFDIRRYAWFACIRIPTVQQIIHRVFKHKLLFILAKDAEVNDCGIESFARFTRQGRQPSSSHTRRQELDNVPSVLLGSAKYGRSVKNVFDGEISFRTGE